MLVEALLLLLVLAVAGLMAVDLTRTSSEIEMPAGQAGGQAPESRRAFIQALGSPAAAELGQPPAEPGAPAAAPDIAPPRHRPGDISPPVADRQRSRTRPAPNRDLRGPLRNWPVRSRLLLLAVIPTLTAIAFGTVLIASSLHRASVNSFNSSVRDKAITSALVEGIVVIVVVLAALLIMLIVARSIVEPLRRLEDGALEVTQVLPDAVRRISEADGENVPLGVEPIGVTSSDEIGVVARAFDEVSGEALRLAANEAVLRGQVSAIYTNLSRRSQALVERQISLIDDLEQGEQDSERLGNLFKMDHLATRMRRNSENLLVLAGHELISRGNQPAPLVDVIRAAVSEIEEYERVSLDAQQGIMVVGPAVNDVVHTVAELAENATSLSSADTRVKISGHLLTSGGALIDITDQGVGMSTDEIARANWQLDNPPLVDVNVSRRMGLFVVGRLAERHGIRVRLRPAPTGGITALVWLPDELITHENTPAQPRLGDFAASAAGPGTAGGLPSRVPRGPRAGHHNGMDGDRGGAAQQVADARTPRFAPLRADEQDGPVDPRRIPGSRSPAASGPATTSPATTGPAAAGPAAFPTDIGREASGAGREDPGWSVAGWNDRAPSDSDPLTASSPFTSRTTTSGTSSARGDAVVPPADSAAGEQRLPVFEAVESDWFRRVHRGFGPSVTAQADGSWASSPADEGWRAAETAASPSSDGLTEAGLPRRVPQANLVPGTATTGPQRAVPPRSAVTTRERFASFQRGVEEGRAAAGPAGDPGREDETS
ncbi:MAG TPA: ATP-binding protein [Streptosporangiaceae bacterium]|nr:ATP-binding protein [Streptosporangiaceae bacterium]